MPTKNTDFVQNKDKTFVIKLTLPQEELQSARTKVLKSHQSNFETKGFRKGKAPLNIVEEHLDAGHIIEDVLTDLISKKYSELVTEKHLHPIIQPQIKALNPPLEFTKDWEIEITGCELPELALDSKYSAAVTKINKSTVNDNEKINQIVSALLNNSKVEIPDILIQADVQNKLSQLVDQTQSAGVTVEQYLKSRNQTITQYQEELQTQVRQEWTTNLAIDRIARDQKLEISQAEVDKVISENKALAKNLNLVYYLLTQQKVFAYLRKL